MKNQGQSRDPELQQSKKSRQCCVGTEVYRGFDSVAGLICGASVSPVNVDGSRDLSILPNGQETILYGERNRRSREAIRQWPFLVDGDCSNC